MLTQLFISLSNPRSGPVLRSGICPIIKLAKGQILFLTHPLSIFENVAENFKERDAKINSSNAACFFFFDYYFLFIRYIENRSPIRSISVSLIFKFSNSQIDALGPIYIRPLQKRKYARQDKKNRNN